MEQTLLLVSVVVALFIIFTKEGKNLAKDVSKSLSSLTSKNRKSGFPVVLVIVIVLGGLMCLSRKRLMEGLLKSDINSEMSIKELCEDIKPDYEKCIIRSKDDCQPLRDHAAEVENNNEGAETTAQSHWNNIGIGSNCPNNPPTVDEVDDIPGCASPEQLADRKRNEDANLP